MSQLSYIVLRSYEHFLLSLSAWPRRHGEEEFSAWANSVRRGVGLRLVLAAHGERERERPPPSHSGNATKGREDESGESERWS